MEQATFYVGGAFLAAALLMTLEPWLLLRQHRKILHRLRERARKKVRSTAPETPEES